MSIFFKCFLLLKTTIKVWGYNSVLTFMLTIYRTLGFVFSTERQLKNISSSVHTRDPSYWPKSCILFRLRYRLVLIPSFCVLYIFLLLLSRQNLPELFSPNCFVLSLFLFFFFFSEAQFSKSEIVAKVNIILYKLKPRMYFNFLPYKTYALIWMYSVQNLC